MTEKNDVHKRAEDLVIALAAAFDGTGCPAIVCKEASDEGISLSLHFPTDRAQRFIEAHHCSVEAIDQAAQGER